MPTFIEHFLPYVDPEDADFFNQDLEFDINACIDPDFISTRGDLTRIPMVSGSFDIFQGMVMGAIASDDRQELRRLILIAEVPEIGFGYSTRGRHGVAFGNITADLFINGVWEYRNEIRNGNRISLAGVFIDNVGQDRISDLSACVIKRELIEYTQNICNDYNIRMANTHITNIFDPNTGQWVEDDVMLPRNPFDERENNGIILVPRNLARSKLVMGYDYFREFFIRYYLDRNVRAQMELNNDQSPTPQKIRQYARAHPEVLQRFIARQQNWLTERTRDRRRAFKCKPRKQNI
ncbi:hypothetical protein J7L68_01325 [bacterium]|nr:hypothetical protein [bacterium]